MWNEKTDRQSQRVVSHISVEMEDFMRIYNLDSLKQKQQIYTRKMSQLFPTVVYGEKNQYLL